MGNLDLTMAQQVVEAAAAFEQQRTGHAPKSVTVVLGEETLVITLHGALSPAERAMAQTPEGASQVQEFHRQLFNDSADWLRNEIKRITGVEIIFHESQGGNRNEVGHGRAGIHDRHRGAGVSARH